MWNGVSWSAYWVESLHTWKLLFIVAISAITTTTKFLAKEQISTDEISAIELGDLCVKVEVYFASAYEILFVATCFFVLIWTLPCPFSLCWPGFGSNSMPPTPTSPEAPFLSFA